MSLLQMTGVSKSFDGNLVLTDVDFSVEAGEIHALLGENGAGKSTLLNIFAGVLPRDAGHIVFNNVVYPRPSIQQMERAGVAFVHQELNVINDLTVAENIFFNRELRHPWRLLRRAEMIDQTRALFDRLGVPIDPTSKVADLKTSQKQLLEICRALHAEAKLLILDEPTTALGNDEIDHLFDIVRSLRDQGHSFIFVSHKMPEIFRLADSYTVLRNGLLISTGRIADTTPYAVTCDMVGEQFAQRDVYQPRSLGEPVLEVQNLTAAAFRNVSFTARQGEILALTGLAGSGASELLQALFGAVPVLGGHIRVNSETVPGGNIGAAMRAGVGMLPTNRKENSVVPDATVLENEYLAEHSLGGSQWIHAKRELTRFEALKETLHIAAPGAGALVTSLSGGNQQKVFVARWLNTDPQVILLDNPTQSVDVGAKEEMYSLILQLATQGKTIVINTLEIPEIQKVSDRCIVMYSGEVAAVLDHAAITETNVMLHSTNAIKMSEDHVDAC